MSEYQPREPQTMTINHALITERYTGHDYAHARCRTCGWTGQDGAPKPPICPNDPNLDAAGELALLNTAMAPHAWHLKIGDGASPLIDAARTTLDILAQDTTPFAQAVQDAGFITAQRAARATADALESAAAALEANPPANPAGLLRQMAADLRSRSLTQERS